MKVLLSIIIFLISVAFLFLVLISTTAYLHENAEPATVILNDIGSIIGYPFASEAVDFFYEKSIPPIHVSYVILIIVLVPNLILFLYRRWKFSRQDMVYGENAKYELVAMYHIESVPYNLLNFFFYIALSCFGVVAAIAILIYASPWDSIDLGFYNFSRGTRLDFWNEKMLPIANIFISALLFIYMYLFAHARFHFIISPPKPIVEEEVKK